MSNDSEAAAGSAQAAFYAALARFGVSPDGLTAQTLRTGDRPGGFVLAADPDLSHLPPTLLQVRDMAHLKELGGTPDAYYTSGQFSDQAIAYPPPLSDSTRQALESAQDQASLKLALSDESYRDLVTAAQAYVHGNSAKVADYEATLNAAYFPAQMAVFAVDAVVVQDGSPLVFASGDPSALVCSTMTVEPGGEVIVQENVTINAQSFTAQ